MLRKSLVISAYFSKNGSSMKKIRYICTEYDSLGGSVYVDYSFVRNVLTP